MCQTDPSINKTSFGDWKILGEREIQGGSFADDALITWLTEILSPLDLHVDFLNRILFSARDAFARDMQLEIGMKFEQSTLQVYVPLISSAFSGTWGFFRIEKNENTAADIRPGHVIAFYLYLERG